MNMGEYRASLHELLVKIEASIQKARVLLEGTSTGKAAKQKKRPEDIIQDALETHGGG